MKIKLFLGFICFGLLFIDKTYSQSLIDSSSIYYILKDGTKVYIYDDSFSVSSQYIIYHKKDSDKEIYVPQKNIQEIVSPGIRFVNLSVFPNGKMKRLHRIIAYNDEYFLTKYWSQNLYILYVFDKDFNYIASVRANPYGKYTDKYDEIKTMRSYIAKYFSDCQILTDEIDKTIFNNSQKKKHEFGDEIFDKYFNNVNCTK